MSRCPTCDREYASDVARCTDCDVALAAADADELVLLLSAPSELALQQARAILEDNGVHVLIEDEAVAAVYGGIVDFVRRTLLVPGRDLERAKALLCEHQIQCEVPKDAIDRVMKRLVLPALEGGAFDPGRFLALLADQTMDFRAALFERTLARAGGPDLLVRLLVGALHAAGVPEDVRRDLAKGLGDRGSALAAATDALTASPDPGLRLRLASTLGRFEDWQTALLLVRLLDDPDPAVRNEAFEALYFRAKGATFRFDPAADAAARAAAIARWRTWGEALR